MTGPPRQPEDTAAFCVTEVRVEAEVDGNETASQVLAVAVSMPADEFEALGTLEFLRRPAHLITLASIRQDWRKFRGFAVSLATAESVRFLH